ncbi:MAG: hypothetical protein ACFFDN_08400 [Candidatus Hodarchaeota archaeon]
MEKKKNRDLDKPKSKEIIEEKKGFKQSLKSLSKKSWYQQHLPWPERVIRKPKIKLGLPKAPKIPVPSRNVVFAVFLVAFAFIIAGFSYDITRNTIPLNYKQEDQTKRIIPVFFWADLHEQFAIEGVVAAIVILIGACGVLFIYQSTRLFYRPKSAYSYLAVGIALIILSFVLIEYFITQKGVKLYSADV